jgi:predicted Fe-Mo cluster-binding NifX family protein
MRTTPTSYEKFIARLKSHRTVAVALALGSVIIALSTFTDAAKNLLGLFKTPGPEEARTSLASMSVTYTPAAFVAAAEEGDVTVVKLFLTAGMDPDMPGFSESRTERLPALAAAAFENRAGVVKLLLQAGAKVVTPDYNNLIGGALSGNVEILNQMLHQRIAHNKLEEAFIVAESRAILEALERAGVNVKKIGATAMIQATSAETVEFLAERGVDVNTKDSDGKSAIQHMMDDSSFTSAAAVLALIDRGADINARDSSGATLLLRAADNGNVDMMQKLLERKADVTVRNADGRNAISLATESSGKRGVQIASLLLGHGVDINGRGTDGKTALHRAAARGDLEFVRLLLEHNADVHVKDSEGNTALSLATNSRSTESIATIIQLLRDHGATDP